MRREAYVPPSSFFAAFVAIAVNVLYRVLEGRGLRSAEPKGSVEIMGSCGFLEISPERARLITAIIAVVCGATVTSGQTNAGKDDPHAQYKPKAGDFAVVCTLFDGRAPAATDAAPREPITYDPRFDIGARIERVTFGQSPWRAGDLITFVIHSPSLQLPRGFAGRRFSLTFSPFRPRTTSERLWFSPETRYLLKAIQPAGAVTSPRSLVRPDASSHIGEA